MRVREWLNGRTRPYGAREAREIMRDFETFAVAAQRPQRPLGACPRSTPGCKYADCSPAAGRACYGPDAPRHQDMGI